MGIDVIKPEDQRFNEIESVQTELRNTIEKSRQLIDQCVRLSRKRKALADTQTPEPPPVEP